MASFWTALRGLDEALFARINQAWTHPWLNAFFPWLTDLDRNMIFVWGALPVAAAWWLYTQKGRAARVLLAMVIAAGFCDAVSYRFIKPYVQRDRPDKAGISVVVRSRHMEGYSFPSNHAANTFAAATVLGMAYPGIRWFALLIAALVAYSRVYTGAHFPLDAAAGAALGLIIGALVGSALKRFGKAGQQHGKKN